MKTLVALVVLFMACEAFLLYHAKHECKTDSDCPSTHCCVNDHYGEYCFLYQNATQPCHLQGHSLHTYKCGCAAGHTCEMIHIDPGNINPDNIHQAEVILGQAGFGLCVLNSTSPH